MQWKHLLSQERLGAVDAVPVTRPGRTEFESDIDRIIFASAFRRLGRKTQVHPLAPNDHVHTRLTHSLEVSRVGKALGRALGERIKARLPKNRTPDDLGTIVEAACLAHDLGNPPFGHAGEEAMIHWFDQNRTLLPDYILDDYRHDLASFEGNAQGFRLVTQLENHIFEGGLRLTYATLGTFQKYPWTSRRKVKKFGAYLSEEAILTEVGENLGLASKSHGWCRHPLAHLVEAADDICYGIIDVEDAVELGIQSFSDAIELLLSVFTKTEQDVIKSQFSDGERMYRVNFARMRGRVFDAVIDGAIEAYMKIYDDIMDGEYDGSLFDALEASDTRRGLIEKAKKLGREEIYTDTKKVEMEVGCYSTFDVLLREFCGAALSQAQVLGDTSGESRLKWKSAHVLRLLGDHAPGTSNAPSGGSWTPYQCTRRVIDFVSGMTDNYAVYIAKQLQGGAFSGGQRP